MELWVGSDASDQPKPPSDEVIATVAQAQDLAFLGFSNRSSFVRLSECMASKITGLTVRAFIPALVVAADCITGPIQHDATTEVDSNGLAKNVASNISGAIMCNVAPCASACV